MRTSLLWAGWIGASTLLLELFLIRIFDTIVGPSAAYALVGLALFGISLAGLTAALRPALVAPRPVLDTSGRALGTSRPALETPGRALDTSGPGLVRPDPVLLSALLAATPVAIWIVLRFVPFSVARIPEEPLVQVVSFLALGLVLTAPFFLGALAILQLLAVGPARRFYAADLAGSALGPWFLPGLLPLAGPAGLLAILAGAQLLATAGWRAKRRKHQEDEGTADPSRAADSNRRVASSRRGARPGATPSAARHSRGRAGVAAVAIAPALAALGLGAIVLGLSGRLERWDIPSHAEKRGAAETRLRAGAEFRRWDPVSKIEVVDLTDAPLAPGEPRTRRKLISYDGGAQSSHIYAFDGDFAALRAHLGERILDHFWQRGVVAAHWLHRVHGGVHAHDAQYEGARVFVAGCAGGQEVTAALLFGAREVVAVDLVGTVVELGRERYAEYNGGIFLDPRVRFEQAEARTSLARSTEPYDVIQIFSYHNSARVASGALALKAFYLQTAETYALCMERLTPDGVLQINQGFFPRVVTTLAAAWESLGRDHLEEHVLVYGRDGVEDHYTILVKRSPWTPAEVADLDRFLLADFPSEGRTYRRIETATDRADSFLPDALYHAPLADSLAERAAFRITPVTDDNPFSLFLRKGVGRTVPDPLRFTTSSEAALLDEIIPQRLPLPRDSAHLVLLGTAGLVVSILAFAIAARVGGARGGAGGMDRGAGDARVGSARGGSHGVDRGAGDLRERPGVAGVESGGERPGIAGVESGGERDVPTRRNVPTQRDIRIRRGRARHVSRHAYFYLIGLGFMGVEWALVQFAFRLIALPIAAFGTAIGVLLIGAALGSWNAERLRVRWVFPGIVALGAVLLVLYPAITPHLWGASLGVRILAFALAALPLAFLLGVPFARGLGRLRHPGEVAAAWALNGAASVTGSVLTAALFASVGIATTLVLALLVYAAAGLAFRSLPRLVPRRVLVEEDRSSRSM